MNDQNSVEGSNEVTTLRGEINHLRKLLVGTLVILTVIVLSLDLYLSRQLISVNKDAAAVRQVVANFQNVEGPRIQIAVGAMQNYAKTHPDFRAILEKYGAAGAAATPATTPTPVTK